LTIRGIHSASTVPLIRRSDAAKRGEFVMDRHVMQVFREATWDEALDFVRWRAREDSRLSWQEILGRVSALPKGSNEEAYLF